MEGTGERGNKGRKESSSQRKEGQGMRGIRGKKGVTQGRCEIMKDSISVKGRRLMTKYSVLRDLWKMSKGEK